MSKVMIRLFFESKKERFGIPFLVPVNEGQGDKLKTFAANNLGKIFVVEIRELEAELQPMGEN